MVQEFTHISTCYTRRKREQLFKSNVVRGCLRCIGEGPSLYVPSEEENKIVLNHVQLFIYII